MANPSGVATPARRRPLSWRAGVALGAVTVLGAGILGVGLVPARAATGGTVALGSALLPGLGIPASGLTDHGLLDPTRSVDVELVLARPHEAAEQAEEAAIYTPGSAQFHHYLSPSEFASTYGVADSTYSAAVSFLTAHGLTLGNVSQPRDVLAASGSVSNVEATFGVALHAFTTRTGTDFFANTTAPLVPASLPVQGLFGLETWHRASLPGADLATGKVRTVPRQSVCQLGRCIGDVTPQDMWSTYDQPATATGVGQSVAIFGEGATQYVIDDLTKFDKENNLPVRTLGNGVQVKLTDGGPATDYTSTDGDGEWQLDTQSSTGMAYAADNLEMYWGKSLTDESTLSTLTYYANDNNAPMQASASYGECEAQPGNPGTLPSSPYESLAYEQSYEKELVQVVMSGRTLFNSSGDNGSACGALPVDLNGVTNAGPPQIAYPSSSPNVVSVGGTILYTTGANPNARALEYGWTDSGGGASSLFPEPSYQSATPAVQLPCLGDFPSGAPDPAAGTCRGIPDISAISGDIVTNGYSIVDDGADSATGGTSLSSPLAAGLWTRLQSGLTTKGSAGFANPQFYKYCNDFFDVGALTGPDSAKTIPSDNGTEGTYPTDTGWDYVTGLGSMDVSKLLADVNSGAPRQTCAHGTIPSAGGTAGPPAPVMSAPPTAPAPTATPVPKSNPTASSCAPRASSLAVSGPASARRDRHGLVAYRFVLSVKPGTCRSPSAVGRQLAVYVDGHRVATLRTGRSGVIVYRVRLRPGRHAITASYSGAKDLKRSASKRFTARIR